MATRVVTSTQSNEELIRDDWTTYRVTQGVYYVLGIVNAFLLLRLLFKVFGANPGSGIVQLIYGLSGVLLVPFRGIFPPAVAGESVMEPAVLVAIMIYSLLAKGLIELWEIWRGR